MCREVRSFYYMGIVTQLRRIQVAEVANTFVILHGSVSKILHDRLNMRKLTAQWVLKTLSNKQIRTTT